MVMVSPVRGLRPCRSFRSFTTKLPNPRSSTRSFERSASAIISRTESTAASTSDFFNSVLAATFSINCCFVIPFEFSGFCGSKRRPAVPGTRRQAVAVVGVSVVAKRVPVWRSGRSQGWGYALACGFVEWEPLASSANRYNVTMPPTPPPEGQARICGTVADASGASIPGTEITVLNLATGVQRTTNTDQAGYYSISFLPAGHYCIAATKDHFSTQQVADILLEVNQQERFEFSMLIGTKLDLSRVPIVKRTSTQLALPEPIGSQLRRFQIGR